MKLFSALTSIFLSIICIGSPLYAADPTLPEAIDSLQWVDTMGLPGTTLVEKRGLISYILTKLFWSPSEGGYTSDKFGRIKSEYLDVGSNITIGNIPMISSSGSLTGSIISATTSSVSLNGDMSLSWNLSITGNITPISNDTYDLGDNSLRWRDIYVQRNAFNGSDRRLKHDIETLSGSTDIIRELRPVRFRWNNASPLDPQGYGFIAQEVENILPDLVKVSNDSIFTRLLNYNEFIPFIVASIQDILRQLDVIIEKQTQITHRQEEIERRLDSLENSLSLQK